MDIGATTREMEDAYRAALFHEFGKDLEDEYEMVLAERGGVALRRKQKQRSVKVEEPVFMVGFPLLLPFRFRFD
jgi:hypothetical protein